MDQEKLSADDLEYFTDTMTEVRTLREQANLLFNFCQARLAKKYKLVNGSQITPEGNIIRPEVKDGPPKDASAT